MEEEDWTIPMNNLNDLIMTVRTNLEETEELVQRLRKLSVKKSELQLTKPFEGVSIEVHSKEKKTAENSTENNTAEKNAQQPKSKRGRKRKKPEEKIQPGNSLEETGALQQRLPEKKSQVKKTTKLCTCVPVKANSKQKETLESNAKNAPKSKRGRKRKRNQETQLETKLEETEARVGKNRKLREKGLPLQSEKPSEGVSMEVHTKEKETVENNTQNDQHSESEREQNRKSPDQEIQLGSNLEESEAVVQRLSEKEPQLEDEKLSEGLSIEVESKKEETVATNTKNDQASESEEDQKGKTEVQKIQLGSDSEEMEELVQTLSEEELELQDENPSEDVSVEVHTKEKETVENDTQNDQHSGSESDQKTKSEDQEIQLGSDLKEIEKFAQTLSEWLQLQNEEPSEGVSMEVHTKEKETMENNAQNDKHSESEKDQKRKSADDEIQFGSDLEEMKELVQTLSEEELEQQDKIPSEVFSKVHANEKETVENDTQNDQHSESERDQKRESKDEEIGSDLKEIEEFIRTLSEELHRHRAEPSEVVSNEVCTKDKETVKNGTQNDQHSESETDQNMKSRDQEIQLGSNWEGIEELVQILSGKEPQLQEEKPSEGVSKEKEAVENNTQNDQPSASERDQERKHIDQEVQLLTNLEETEGIIKKLREKLSQVQQANPREGISMGVNTKEKETMENNAQNDQHSESEKDQKRKSEDEELGSDLGGTEALVRRLREKMLQLEQVLLHEGVSMEKETVENNTQNDQHSESETDQNRKSSV